MHNKYVGNRTVDLPLIAPSLRLVCCCAETMVSVDGMRCYLVVRSLRTVPTAQPFNKPMRQPKKLDRFS